MFTKYDHAEKYAKIARKEWFKNHQITVTEFESTSNASTMTVIDFRKPGTSAYAVRYIFSGHYVYVSGDLGAATFNCTWPVTPTDINWRRDRWYIYEKLEASRKSDFSEFDADVCVTTIRNTMLMPDKKGNHTCFPEDWNKEERSVFNDLILAAKECSSTNEWYRIIDRNNEYGEIEALDADWWEWLSGAGEVMPPTIIGMIEGLWIISERLSDNNAKGEGNG